MKVLVLVFAFALSGCGFLQRQDDVPPASPYTEPGGQLAQGYVLLEHVRLLAADALKNRLISVEKAKSVLRLSDTAQQALDSARDLHFSGVVGAEQKGLETAKPILDTLQNDIENEMKARTVKKGGK